MAHPQGYQPEEWALLATLIGEADLAIRESGHAAEHLKELLAEVVEDLREVTNDFSDPVFLRGSPAGRRRNTELFSRGG